MASCGRLLIGPLMNSELFTGRLPIGRRLPTWPTRSVKLVAGINTRQTILICGSFAALMLLSLSATAQEPSHHVVAVSIDSVVHPITVEIVKHAMEQAQTEHAELLLIRLNTPGRLLDPTRHLIQDLSPSPVPVPTYHPPTAAPTPPSPCSLLTPRAT